MVHPRKRQIFFYLYSEFVLTFLCTISFFKPEIPDWSPGWYHLLSYHNKTHESMHSNHSFHFRIFSYSNTCPLKLGMLNYLKTRMQNSNFYINSMWETHYSPSELPLLLIFELNNHGSHCLGHILYIMYGHWYVVNEV